MKMKFKKIALVTPYYYPLYGGVQEYVYHLKKEYKKMGYTVKVITGSFKGMENLNKEDEKDVIRIGYGVPFLINGSTGRIIMIRRGERVRQALEAENFDIIHFQEPFVPFLSHDVMKYSKALNIATFHANFESNFYYRFFRPFLYLLWDRLHGKAAVSPSAKSSISRYFPGNGIEIIPNGVDTKRFSPKGKKIKKFLDGKINILFTGRIEKRKGLSYLLQAFALLKKKNDGIRLIIVGRGPLEKELRQYVKNNSIKDVHFEGFVPIKTLPGYYRTSHIYSSPALFGESFGIVLLEAMAAGLPVLAFDISGYNDVVANNEDGLLAQPRDLHDLYQKLSMLVENQPLAREIGARGLAKSKRFDWKLIARRNIAFYKKLWEKRG